MYLQLMELAMEGTENFFFFFLSSDLTSRVHIKEGKQLSFHKMLYESPALLVS